MGKNIYLIDGHALIFKMYYAFIRRPMINSKGIDTSILFGFTKYILELIEREKPTHLAVAFDPPGGTFRNSIYPEYKATREETPQLVIDSLEPLTAEQSLLASQNSLMTLETSRKTIEPALRNLMNLRPEDPLDIASTDILATPLTHVDLNVPVAALGLRPDVKAAEYRIQSAFLDWESVKASVYPSITIGSTLSVSSDESSSLFNIPFLAGAVQINLPFLQWNKIKWNIKISEADFENAKLNLISAVNMALNEVDTYYYSYRKSLSLLENVNRKYDTDAQISVYNQLRYEAGSYELKDWLDAKCTENTSRLNLLEAKYNAISYENAIYKALGARLTGNPQPSQSFQPEPTAQSLEQIPAS